MPMFALTLGVQGGGTTINPVIDATILLNKDSREIEVESSREIKIDNVQEIKLEDNTSEITIRDTSKEIEIEN